MERAVDDWSVKKSKWRGKWIGGLVEWQVKGKVGNPLMSFRVKMLSLALMWLIISLNWINYTVYWVIALYLMNCTVHTEKSNKMQQCVKIYYSIFMWSSTCFGRHTSHHQEPKTALSASGLPTWNVFGRVVAGRWQRPATTRPTTLHVCKPEAASAVLGSW
jgi:hypothetical protein